MKKPYYYEFALVLVAALLLIFVVYMIERTVEYYYLQKNKTVNGTQVIVQKFENKTEIKMNLTDIKTKINELDKKIEEIRNNIKMLLEDSKLIKSQIKIILNQTIKIYNKVVSIKPETKIYYYNTTQRYIYNITKTIDDERIKTLMEYLQGACKTTACKKIDEALAIIDEKIRRDGTYRELLYNLKKDLIITKALIVSKENDKDFVKSVIIETIQNAIELDKKNYDDYDEISEIVLNAMLLSCNEFNIKCAYVFYLPGQESLINDTNYDIVVAFDATREDSKFIKDTIVNMNITVFPYYLSNL